MRPAKRNLIAFLVWCLTSIWTASLPSQETADEPESIAVVNANDAVELPDEFPIGQYDREHWAFRPVTAPAIPSVHDATWPRTPIDRFILAELDEAGLRPAARADRETLLRRLSFDLTGLPPTSQQLDDFLSDDRPDAYPRLVDQMLASPELGRRWGQHWLDLARFAETDGFEHDKIRPTAWQYRDWVIDSINSDLPYDEFLTLQLAGDVLRPDDPQAVTATAFCLSGPDMPDINLQEERKHVLMNELTSTIGSALLSLQMGCAQCHDHKYDAISQADFYRLRAFFEPAIQLKRDDSITVLGLSTDPNAVARLYHRGDWRNPGPPVRAAFPRIANTHGTPVTSGDPGQQRVELARWLADPSNPLTSRSIVNRVWQFHFGRGLSSTPSDFGLMGEEPTHAELLNYLASRLMNGRWSLKRLHREILRSAVYCTSSVGPAESEQRTDWQLAIESDPGNRWLSRFPRRRLDAESIRDAMLASSDGLNFEGGGPGVSPPLPEELVKTLKSGQWKVSERRANHYRRSVFVFARRNLRYPLFATFDRPAADCSCAVRHPSTTALQSLSLLNSEFSLEAATQVVESLHGHSQDLDAVCRELYGRVISRNPSDDELQTCVKFVRQQSERLAEEGSEQPRRDALIDLSLALFNSNGFLYVD
jgi:hypothetical protein